MHIKLSPFRSSPPDVFSKEDAPRHDVYPNENTNTEARFQQSRFATLLNHTHAQIRPRKFPAHPQNTLVRDSTSGGLILHVKRILKVLYYEKFLFTVVKRNSLVIKMDNNNNNNNNNNNKSNKYPVIVSRSPRNVLGFFHWTLLLWHQLKSNNQSFATTSRPCH